MEKRNCLWCDDKYYETASYFHIDGFCSEECYSAFKEINVELPLKVNRRQSKICEVCGSTHYTKYPFCSGECSIKYCDEHGIWYQRVKLKLPPRYCKKFNLDLKERVRTFFNNKCVMCGASEIENGKTLSVHHVNYDKKAGCNGNKLSFVPLCKSCHSKVHSNRDYWKKYFEDIIENEYNSKCYYTKEEYRELKEQECSS